MSPFAPHGAHDIASGGGGTDKFRIKIWDAEDDIVYDNQIGQPNDAVFSTAIEGGSIVVQKEKTR